MHQFVQSAIEAAQQGDNSKALVFLKQALNANPNDVDAWLVLSAVVDDPRRKRHCLNRVLKLDPANQIACDELAKMDRAEGGDAPWSVSDPPAQVQHFDSASNESASVSTPQPYEEYMTEELIAILKKAEEEDLPSCTPRDTLRGVTLDSSSKVLDEEIMVFQYSPWVRNLMYFLIIFSGFSGLMITPKSFIAGMFFVTIGLLMLAILLFTFPNVEIRDTGIRVATAFSGNEVRWDGIINIKPNAPKSRLEIYRKNGEVVKLSTNVDGYQQIVEILRKRRPDLFVTNQMSSIGLPALESDNAAGLRNAGAIAAAPTFAGDRIFKKSFLKQFGSYLYLIPMCLLVSWLAFAKMDNKTALILSVIVWPVMLVLPLFQVNTVTVTQKTLTIESFFEQKVFSAREINAIKMQTVRELYGQATNYVNILPIKGKTYSLTGFPESEETIFGVLTNWWIAHRGV